VCTRYSFTTGGYSMKEGWQCTRQSPDVERPSKRQNRCTLLMRRALGDTAQLRSILVCSLGVGVGEPHLCCCAKVEGMALDGCGNLRSPYSSARDVGGQVDPQ
jgi:hypothetical protein